MDSLSAKDIRTWTMNGIEQRKAYWLSQLSEPPPPPKLPWDKERPPVSSFIRETVSTEVQAEVWRGIKSLAARAATTPQVALLAALQALLFRYTGQTDLIVGTILHANSGLPPEPMAPGGAGIFAGEFGRNVSLLAGEFQGQRTFSGQLLERGTPPGGMPGLRALAALRSRLAGQSTAQELVLQVGVSVREASGHLAPFQSVLEWLGRKVETPEEGLFNVAFIPSEPVETPVGPSGADESAELDHLMACALVVRAREANDGLRLSWEFDAELFEGATVERLAGHFTNSLAEMASKPQAPIERLGLLSEAERRQLLVEWNATEAEVPKWSSIQQVIEARAKDTPDAIAVVCRNQQLTYAELNARANQVAAYLSKLGVRTETLVGICVERSLEMLVGLLGILKSGGAYVPLDPVYPSERLAFMIQDAQVQVLITQQHLAPALGSGPEHPNTAIHSPDSDQSRNGELTPKRPGGSGRSIPQVCLDSDWPAIAAEGRENVERNIAPHHLAYVMYTSGSTGKPKGVMVEHGNVLNFFAGMDARIPYRPGSTWLAVTSPSFDISGLELFWTLARGFKVVIFAGEGVGGPARLNGEPPAKRGMEFSLFYFSSDQTAGPGGPYRLLIEGARFADEHGFAAVWTPERHFHEFGALYPNPSVTSAALAMITRRVQIRSGSVVAPLHSPIRIAEEWSVVDNLSNGRAAISFASGWMPEDFAVSPASYGNRKEIMFQHIDAVRRLWRGERVPMPGPLGKEVQVKLFPRPVQKELPVWLTAAGNPETFKMAGTLGMNLLTHLLGQSIEEVGKKVALYRKAWKEAGHPGNGHVTLMLHTFVSDNVDTARATVSEPLVEYLRQSADLIKGYAWAFSAFKQTVTSREEVDLSALPQAEMNALLKHSFNRYFESSGLFGTPHTCMQTIERLSGHDIDEVACLIDFGVSPDVVLANLKHLNTLREAVARNSAVEAADDSIPALIQRHGVTHLQCTPSMAGMLLLDEPTRKAFGRLETLLLGGEALPLALVKQLQRVVKGAILNMYGPTETTIWSSTYQVLAEPTRMPVGRPIANTEFYILDQNLLPAPVGVPGELMIGGAGMARGYLGRAELTTQRFIPSPFAGNGAKRLYRTGDLARYLPDGNVELLGRMDHQVKIRGHRVELGEIEALLNEHPAVRESVMLLKEVANQDKRLVAYVILREGKKLTRQQLRRYAQEKLPEQMVPAQVVFMTAFPQTPNKKIDRNALPAPEGDSGESESGFEPPTTEMEKALAGLWSELLGIERVGRQDDFFAAGGHSLLAMQLVARIRSRFGVDLLLKHLFERPTVAGLAEIVEALSWSAPPPAPLQTAGEREVVEV